MMKVLAALAAIAMLSHAVAADEYVWQEDKPSGNFTFSKVDMKLQGGGSDWKPRAIAQVVMQGRTEKKNYGRNSQVPGVSKGCDQIHCIRQLRVL